MGPLRIGLASCCLLAVAGAQDATSRPALEATETLLLDDSLAVRLPPAAERPKMDPLLLLIMASGKGQPGATLLERPTEDGWLALRAVQLPWRASADFGKDVAREVATWERVDPLHRRFRIEPLALVDGSAVLVRPDAIVRTDVEDPLLAPGLPTPGSPVNAVAFLKRPDGLVQEVAFYQADAASDRTALSRAVAATLRPAREPLATGPRRVDVFLDILHLDLPDGWLSSAHCMPPGSVRVLIRKVVPFGQPAPTLAVQALCDVDAVFFAGLPGAMARESATELFDALVWPPTARNLLRVASGVAGLLAALSTLPALASSLPEPFADFPLAGETRPAGLRLQRRACVSWSPRPGDPRIVGMWYGAPDPGSLAEVEALANQVRAAARPR